VWNRNENDEFIRYTTGALFASCDPVPRGTNDGLLSHHLQPMISSLQARPADKECAFCFCFLFSYFSSSSPSFLLLLLSSSPIFFSVSLTHTLVYFIFTFLSVFFVPFQVACSLAPRRGGCAFQSTPTCSGCTARGIAPTA
jgi:hypothetical protein